MKLLQYQSISPYQWTHMTPYEISEVSSGLPAVSTDKLNSSDTLLLILDKCNKTFTRQTRHTHRRGGGLVAGHLCKEDH